jgi:hypothetical protein
MAYRTLGDLRSKLLARLGMGAMGASGGANQVAIDSFLENGQAQLYEMTDWKHLIWYEDKDLGVDQNQLDYPDAAARNKRVFKVETVYSGQWRKMTEGIETAHWNTMDMQSFPSRYERYAQLLIYPKANAVYTIRQWYVGDLGSFSANDDTATLDDNMIFLHALANAKAHYRHPDAGTYQGQLNTLLASIRGRSFGSNRVYKRDEVPPPEARPAVVGRDV